MRKAKAKEKDVEVRDSTFSSQRKVGRGGKSNGGLVEESSGRMKRSRERSDGFDDHEEDKGNKKMKRKGLVVAEAFHSGSDDEEEEEKGNKKRKRNKKKKTEEGLDEADAFHLGSDGERRKDWVKAKGEIFEEPEDTEETKWSIAGRKLRSTACNSFERGLTGSKQQGLVGSSRKNYTEVECLMCHQCQRNDKGKVIRCTKCKRKRFCMPCLENWWVFKHISPPRSRIAK